jgi:predicted NBD/HSP70 family sugar kinase
MRMFAGLDVGFKRTAVCVVNEAGRIVWRGVVDTHPEALSKALQHWGGKLAKRTSVRFCNGCPSRTPAG